MAAAAQCAAPTPKRYQRRRPERTLWYRIVQTHLETWLELASGEDGEAPPAHVERTFRRYLECGILAHGFARAYCDECQHKDRKFNRHPASISGISARATHRQPRIPA